MKPVLMENAFEAWAAAIRFCDDRKTLGVRPHKEKINISKEFINKTRRAVAPYAALIITHLFVVSSRQRSYDRLRCEDVIMKRCE